MATVQDILDRKNFPVSFSFRSDPKGPIPDQIGFDRNSAAWEFNQKTYLWEKKDPGVPRHMYDMGSGQYIGVGAEDGYTNSVEWSADVSNWGTVGVNFLSNETSFIEGGTARRFERTSTPRATSPAGSFSSGNEFVFGIMERVNSSEDGIAIWDNTANGYVIRLDFNWSNEELNVKKNGLGNVVTRGGEKQMRAHVIEGKNGGKAVIILAEYVADNPGNTRQFWGMPAIGGGEGIVHGGQIIEDILGTGSFIVTDGTPTVKNGENIRVFGGGTPPWWNKRQGTIYVEYYKTGFNGRLGFLVADGGNTRWVYNGGTYDGQNRVSPGGRIFETGVLCKAAVSLTRNEMRSAKNGKVAVGPHNGSLLTHEEMNIGGGQAALREFRYSPVAASPDHIADLTSS